MVSWTWCDGSGFLVDARHHHDSSGIKQDRSDLVLESAFLDGGGIVW